MANDKSDFAYNAMRNLIIYKKWQPGEIHSILEVANKLKISRTPVAEAVKLLEAQGLVKTIPHKGFVVSIASQTEMQETFEIKTVIEGLATKKAALNPDPEKGKVLLDILKKQKTCIENHDLAGLTQYDLEFHFAIFRLSGSAMLQELATSLWHRGHSYIDWLEDWKILNTIYEEHVQLADAIIEGRAEDAQKVMEQHWSRYAKALVNNIQPEQSYDYEALRKDPALAEKLLMSP